jgi:serine/threonine-protein kinase RsbW
MLRPGRSQRAREMVLSDPVDRTGPPNVRLNLSNRPENVMLVRQMLAGVAEAVDLDANDLNDISTAVTEACNNVVIHAYAGAEGPLEVEVYVLAGTVVVMVRDRGGGISSTISAEADTAGIGLSVIEALAERADFRDAEDIGTEVWMTFGTPHARALARSSEDELEQPAIVGVESSDAVEIIVAPTPLAWAILPRLLSALAARAHFRTDRIADIQLVADALTAQVPASISGSHLSIGISVEPRDLELRISPLLAGHAQQLVVESAGDGLGPLIGKLSTSSRVATVGSSDHEMLALRLHDRR